MWLHLYFLFYLKLVCFFGRILIILVLVILIYNYLRTDLSLEKKVLNVKHMEDGVSVINVVMTVRNKTFREIKNVKVSDFIYNVVDDPYFAGLRPVVNRKSDNKRTLMWNIESLSGRGEIVMAYSIKMKLRFVDKLTLPTAFCKYTRKGRPITFSSNHVKLFGY